jgi:hypothetical protein
MWNEDEKKALLNVCKEYIYPDKKVVIVCEPYLPYRPKIWNGILVLAEAQSSNASRYWDKLRDLDETAKMTRLGRKELQDEEGDGDIGIGPWDDGTIKFALQVIFKEACPKLKLEEIAVSNAVPWTRGSGKDGKNLSPDEQMEIEAAKFWGKIFDVWHNIKVLITLGKVAERVMKNAGILKNEKFIENWLKLYHPSYTNRVKGVFCCDDLKTRFREVQKTLDSLDSLDEELKKQLKIEKEYDKKVFLPATL